MNYIFNSPGGPQFSITSRVRTCPGVRTCPVLPYFNGTGIWGGETLVLAAECGADCRARAEVS